VSGPEQWRCQRHAKAPVEGTDSAVPPVRGTPAHRLPDGRARSGPDSGFGPAAPWRRVARRRRLRTSPFLWLR